MISVEARVGVVVRRKAEGVTARLKNRIEDADAQALADALKVDHSVTQIDLHSTSRSKGRQ